MQELSSRIRERLELNQTIWTLKWATSLAFKIENQLTRDRKPTTYKKPYYEIPQERFKPSPITYP